MRSPSYIVPWRRSPERLWRKKQTAERVLAMSRGCNQRTRGAGSTGGLHHLLDSRLRAACSTPGHCPCRESRSGATQLASAPEVVDLSHGDDVEEAARPKRPRTSRTGLNGGMLSDFVILDGLHAIVQRSPWTVANLPELDRREELEDGERLLLFFTRGVHHALAAVQRVGSITSFVHLCSLGRPLPTDVRGTLTRLRAVEQELRGCPRQQNGTDCGFFVLSLARFVASLSTFSGVRRIESGAVDKVTDRYIAEQRQWLRGLQAAQEEPEGQ